MKHKLINVHLAAQEMANVGDVTGQCSCRQWMGIAKSVAALNRKHADHVKFQKEHEK